MKKKLLTITYLSVAVIIADFIFEFLGFSNRSSTFFQALYFLTFSLLYFFAITSLTYKVFYDMGSHIAKVVFFIVMSFSVAMFLSNRTLAITRLWHYASNPERHTDSWLLQDDSKLGYRGIPNASGYYDYFIGDSIQGKVPVFFDSLGYRTVSKKVQRGPSDTLDLYLGCSFTFGDYINAEESFAVKTSGRLGHIPWNAGMSGHGLAQMIQFADSLIPKQKFRYVFIQMSSWLVERAVKARRTTIYGYKSFPYFSIDGGQPILNYPTHTTFFSKKAKEWHLGSRDYLEKLQFVLYDGLVIEFADYLLFNVVKLLMKLQVIPEPANNLRLVETYVYDHIVQLCKENGAIPVIVKVAYADANGEDLKGYLKGKGTAVADIDEATKLICARLAKPYKQLFTLYHQHRFDSIPFDNHPNPYLTGVISDVIVNELSKQNRQKP